MVHIKKKERNLKEQRLNLEHSTTYNTGLTGYFH